MNIIIPDQRNVLCRYGPEKQSLQHCEELAELTQAVSKMRRSVNSGNDDTGAYYNLVEEIADVLVCIQQMKLMYGIDDCEIQKAVNYKCRRQETRMRRSVIGSPERDERGLQT